MLPDDGSVEGRVEVLNLGLEQQGPELRRSRHFQRRLPMRRLQISIRLGSTNRCFRIRMPKGFRCGHRVLLSRSSRGHERKGLACNRELHAQMLDGPFSSGMSIDLAVQNAAGADVHPVGSVTPAEPRSHRIDCGVLRSLRSPRLLCGEHRASTTRPITVPKGTFKGGKALSMPPNFNYLPLIVALSRR